MVQASPSPLLAKAELTKLRFAQLLERTSVMCHRSFVSDRVSFYDGSYRRAEFPFFAKKGWTRPQENAAKLPLIGADGVVVSSYRLSTPTVLISGGLKQLPRLRQQGRRTFSLWRSHPFFAKKGNTRAKPFVLFWTALPVPGGELLWLYNCVWFERGIGSRLNGWKSRILNRF